MGSVPFWAIVPLAVAVIGIGGLSALLRAENPLAILLTVRGGSFGLLVLYGLIRIIFLYGFDVALWNPFA
jgi:hypothetical protein